MKSVIILRGVSGCGKTTLANHLKAKGNTAVVSADHYMLDDKGNWKYSRERLNAAKDLCMRDFMHCLEQNIETIVVDNTNIRPEHFQPYQQLAEAHCYSVFVLTVENHSGYKDVHNVPFEAKEWQTINLRQTIVLR